MSDYALLLTLGHNSSAILLRDGEVLGGYETERMTMTKSDSSFPYTPIIELMERFDIPNDVDIYVSHWFVDAKLPEKNKYWDPEFLATTFTESKITSLSQKFTHHDAHMWSSVTFVGKKLEHNATLVVADGFGNFGECISVYQCDEWLPKLVRRVHGYNCSLGMFYQYATAYMGMKMHNHEYKILGYETHITDVLSADQITQVEIEIERLVRHFKRLHVDSLSGVVDEFDPLISLSALPNVQVMINDLLDSALKKLDMFEAPTHEMRVIVSYIVQAVTERVIIGFIAPYQPTQLICSGGLFYNVKINRILSENYNFEVMPLAGDQGTAIGLYHAHRRDFKWPGNLFWGHREFYKSNFKGIDGIICCDNDDDIFDTVVEAIEQNGFVNLVRGPMEFGPRSLCNTATLALPMMHVVNTINELNDRTSVMPMAPVVTQEKFDELFLADSSRLSFDYMIVAAQYMKLDESIEGAAHFYPMTAEFTGRPQIARDPLIIHILNRFNGILINTSFNVHGVPIVYDAAQVIHSHVTQASKGEAEVITVVKTED